MRKPFFVDQPTPECARAYFVKHHLYLHTISENTVVAMDEDELF